MSNFLIIKLIVQPVLLKRVRISMQLDADEKLLREHGASVLFLCWPQSRNPCKSIKLSAS
jgi:hypothetical protein